MPIDESNKYDPIKHKYIFIPSNAVFIMGFLLMSVVEANLILHLWIKPKHPIDDQIALCLQLGFLFPAILIFFSRFIIGKNMKKGDISPSFASGLCVLLGSIFLVVYSAFTLFLIVIPR